MSQDRLALERLQERASEKVADAHGLRETLRRPAFHHGRRHRHRRRHQRGVRRRPRRLRLGARQHEGRERGEGHALQAMVERAQNKTLSRTVARDVMQRQCPPDSIGVRAVMRGCAMPVSMNYIADTADLCRELKRRPIFSAASVADAIERDGRARHPNERARHGPKHSGHERLRSSRRFGARQPSSRVTHAGIPRR